MARNKKDKVSVNELADALSKDRTTIQKNVSLLIRLKVIKREQTNLNRGFRHDYSFINGKERFLAYVFNAINQESIIQLSMLSKFSSEVLTNK
ncbi:MAG: hypothetical protein PF569_01930 [Candidatus Woesearchaeota archaeon]|nr:hypothetical protein [Candidatus Woesearchaeota archaeon]